MRKPFVRPRIASRGVTKKVKPVPLQIVKRDPELLIDRLEMAIGRLIAAATILEALYAAKT